MKEKAMPPLAEAGAASVKCVAAPGPITIALLAPVIAELTVSIPVVVSFPAVRRVAPMAGSAILMEFSNFTKIL